MRRLVASSLLGFVVYGASAGCGEVQSDLIVRAEAGPVACTSDAECAGAEPRCELSSGRCVACLDAGDCADGTVCVAPAQVCVESCVTRGCGDATPVCNTETGLCRACGGDAECSGGRCRDDGACVECLGLADCDDDDAPLCSAAGRCVECVDDGHCDDLDERCNTQLGVCAEPCSESVPCGADDPYCDMAVGFCVECRVDADCDADERCRRSECQDLDDDD